VCVWERERERVIEREAFFTQPACKQVAIIKTECEATRPYLLAS